jgi:hypothetical protein
MYITSMTLKNKDGPVLANTWESAVGNIAGVAVDSVSNGLLGTRATPRAFEHKGGIALAILMPTNDADVLSKTWVTKLVEHLKKQDIKVVVEYRLTDKGLFSHLKFRRELSVLVDSTK